MWLFNYSCNRLPDIYETIIPSGKHPRNVLHRAHNKIGAALLVDGDLFVVDEHGGEKCWVIG